MAPEISEVKARANGNWDAIFSHLLPNYSPKLFSNTCLHGPCPICGGTDRFWFLPDREITGSAWCNQCEGTTAGKSGWADGIDLLKAATGEQLPRLLERINQVIGAASRPTSAPKPRAKKAEDDEQKRKRKHGAIKAVWKESIPVNKPGAELVWRYLRWRGIDTDKIELSDSIRFSPSLQFLADDGSRKTRPGMVAQVMDGNGKQVTLHRTLFKKQIEKRLLPVPGDRKLAGSAIHVGGRGTVLHVAEGIETVLAVMQMTGCTGTYASALDAHRLANMRLPKQSRVIIWGDYDASCEGRRSAMHLANRLNASGYHASIMIPDTIELATGEKSRDWLDVLAGDHQDLIALAAHQAGLTPDDVQTVCETNA